VVEVQVLGPALEQVQALALAEVQQVMEVQVPVQELVDQELPLAREQELEQALAQALAQGQDPELLRVLELVVQALEQVVRVTAQEMAQVRAEVLELALEVGLVEEEELELAEEEAPVLALVPDLVQLEEQVEVLEQGWV
jgi:hypothetical protein